MVLSDIMKRWQVLLGRRAILSTGIDEHGMKVQQGRRGLLYYFDIDYSIDSTGCSNS
jgi:hypothetical protein